MDDSKSVLDNSDGHQLLTVVPFVHHHGVDETLHNWALSLPAFLNLLFECLYGKYTEIKFIVCHTDSNNQCE